MFYDGTYADELSRTEITQPLQLVTKEYVDYEIANTGGAGGSLRIGDKIYGEKVFYFEPGGQHGMIVSLK